MTETHATIPPTGPVFPPGRYGRRRAPGGQRGRGLMILALVAVVAAATALAVRLYQQYGDPAYRAEVVSYTDITDTGLVITFRVRLPPGEGAVCAVRARDRSGAVVGRGEVAVPAGRQQFSHSLRTTARPFIGEVVRCRSAG